MFKFIRCLLYGFASICGVAGLAVGGTPLVQFVREWFREYGTEREYYDTIYLHEPEIIFLLSLILLVCVCFCIALEKVIIASANPSQPATPEKTAEPSRVEAAKIPPATTEPAPPPESTDDKLTRLLNRDKN